MTQAELFRDCANLDVRVARALRKRGSRKLVVAPGAEGRSEQAWTKPASLDLEAPAGSAAPRHIDFGA